MIRLHIPSALAVTRDLILSVPDLIRVVIERIAARMELVELPDPAPLSKREYRIALVMSRAKDAIEDGRADMWFDAMETEMDAWIDLGTDGMS